MSASKAATAKVVHQPRRLDLLKQLGAVNEAQAKLMKRAAVLLAEEPLQPEAITVSPEALEQLALPKISASLFPKEKRLRPKLWQAIEWEEAPPALPAQEAPSSVVDVSKVQLPGDADVRVNVDKLPKELQELAQRVQLVCKDINEDGILIANVEKVIGNPVFPADEREQLTELRRALLDVIASSAPVLSPLLEVPYPGIQRYEVQHSGSTPVFLVSDLAIVETATYQPDRHELYVRLAIQQTLSTQIDVPDGEQLLLMDHDPRRRRDDFVLDSGSHGDVQISGLYRMERWKDGERLESSDINFPRIGRQAGIDLSAFAGFQFRHNGDPVPRVLTEKIDMTAMHNGGRSSISGMFRYSFDLPPSEAIDPVFEPKMLLDAKPGRYQLGKDLVVDLFPSGAVRAKLADFPFSPLQRDNRGYSGDLDASADEDARRVRITINIEGNVRIQQNPLGDSVNVDLNPNFRIT